MQKNICKIGLVACSKTKKDGYYPAKQLYAGQLFKWAFKYCKQNYDTVFILSAKYGLLCPDQKICAYDETLNDKGVYELKLWAFKVYHQIKDLNLEKEYFYFHCGRAYRKFLQSKLKGECPTKGLGTGRQLHFYKERERETWKV